MWVWLLAGVLALAATNGFLLWKLDQQRKDLTAEILTLRETVSGDISGLREATSASTHRTIESLSGQLETARRQAAAAAGKAKVDAVRHAEELAQQLAAEQKKQQQEVADELSGLKDANTAVNAKAAEISGEVKNVKTELDSATADLKSMRGDLGVQSGLIATNARELAALRALGERNYFEFSLVKSKQAQQVGNIRLALQKTDPKRNKFTLAVIADDKRI
jgi:chromosome segregation ATPase